MVDHWSIFWHLFNALV